MGGGIFEILFGPVKIIWENVIRKKKHSEDWEQMAIGLNHWYRKNLTLISPLQFSKFNQNLEVI